MSNYITKVVQLTYRHTVDEDANQEGDDEYDEQNDYDPFVSPPNDVAHGLERRREPQERSGGTTGDK